MSRRTSSSRNSKSINGDEASYRQSLLDDERASEALQSDDVPSRCSGWYAVVSVLFALVVGTAAAAFGAAIWSQDILATKATFSCSAVSSIAIAALTVPPLIVVFLLVLALPCKFGERLRRLGARRTVKWYKKLGAFGLVAFALIVLLLILFALGAVSGVMIVASKTVPSLTDTLPAPLAGLDGPIQIVRDENGITHIRAETQRDALFGQGFVHAQDRLWEMEFQRLAVEGRLAEHLGGAALKFDKQTRTLNFVAAAQLLCSNLTAEETRVFQHYIDGINFYLKTVPQRPPEFLIMSTGLFGFHEPKPYAIIDACYAARLMQWRLSLNVNEEIDRFNIFWKTNRSYDEIWELYANQTNITNTILTAEQMNLTEADALAQRARERDRKALESQLYSPGGYIHNLRQLYGSMSNPTGEENSDSHRRDSRHRDRGLAGLDLRRLHRAHASNAWVARSATGHACQASDPHLDINLPSIWYYVHLSWGDHDFAGVGLVGLPAIHIGKSRDVSWGITMSMTDLIDLFLLVPSATQPATHYVHNGVDHPYIIRYEVIKVKGGEDVVLTVKDTRYGPVATEALGLPRPDVLNFAVSGRALQPDNTSVHAVYNMINPNVTTAMDVRDMIFANMQSPGFSIPATDRHGNLVYLMTGSHVERAEGHTGFVPTLGNGSFDWVRFIPYTELPTLVIPATQAGSGAISAANQKIYPDGYRHFLGYDYALPDRGGRLHQLVNTTLPVNLSDVRYHIAVQTDIHSNLWGLFFKPLLQNGTDINGRPVEYASSFRSRLSSGGQQWFDSLTTLWDGKAAVGSFYESYFVLWYRELTLVPQDVIAALDIDQWEDSAFGYFLLAAPTQLKETQCAARSAALGFPVASNSSAAFGQLCLELAAQLWNAQALQYPSTDVESLPLWGVDLNNLHATNLMLHDTPLACFLDRVMQKDGDWSSIDVADHASLAGDIKVTAASSMRQVYTWGAPESIHFALPGGESGNPFSDRYQNLLLPFVLDQYVGVVTEGGVARLEHNVSIQSILP